MNTLIKEIDSDYGVLVSKNEQIIYENYVGNNKHTRFRVMSLSKPITAMAIFILLQQNKLKLTDTIDKFDINIPFCDKITINHLLFHTSGIYDFTSELYFKLNPRKLFNDVIKKYETKMIEFKTAISEINKHNPYFKPQKDPFKYEPKNYNNTGYDLLGYVIYAASGIKTDKFIKKYIFEPLNMNNSGFNCDKHVNESIPYEPGKIRGIKEQQNWYCGNAYVSCSLQDYDNFLTNYDSLLTNKYLSKYKKLYYFQTITIKDKKYKIFCHEGGGDFRHKHSVSTGKLIKYTPLSRSLMCSYLNKTDKINIIVSENHQNTNGFFANNYKNWASLVNIVL